MAASGISESGFVQTKEVLLKKPELDSFGQALSNRSDSFLIRTSLKELPKLVAQEEERVTDRTNKMNAYIGILSDLMETRSKWKKTDPRRKDLNPKISRYQNMLRHNSELSLDLAKRKANWERLQLDLQCYISEALNRGLISVSEASEALKEARLPAAVALLSSNFSPPTNGSELPVTFVRAEIPSVEVVQESNSPEFDFDAADRLTEFIKEVTGSFELEI